MDASKNVADAPTAAPWSKPLGLMRHPLIAIPYALSILLALLVPEDAFSKWSWAKAWFDLVAQFVPIVGNYARRSAFPEAAGLYFAIVVVLMAPCILMAAITTRGLFDEQAIRSVRVRRGLLYEVPAWLMALLFLFLAYFCVAINPGYDFNLMPINRSRIALALFGPLFAGGISAVCLAAGMKLSQLLLRRRG
jgi:hypothetical protein